MGQLNLTETQYKSLLMHTLDLLEAEFSSDLPISTVKLLLQIPSKGTVSMTQLVKQAKMSPAGVSRTMATLGGYRATNRRVLEHPFVVVEDDPMDRRYKTVGLTDYGRQFMGRMVGLVDRYAAT